MANGMRTERVEARQEPSVRHAYGTTSEWLADRFEQQRPRYARWHIGCFATKAASNTVKWLPWVQGRVSVAGDPAAAHSGVSTLRAPCQDTHS